MEGRQPTSVASWAARRYVNIIQDFLNSEEQGQDLWTNSAAAAADTRCDRHPSIWPLVPGVAWTNENYTVEMVRMKNSAEAYPARSS